MDKWLNLPEAAQYLGCCRDVVDELIAEGDFPEPRYLTDSERGRRWHPETLKAWLDSRTKAA